MIYGVKGYLGDGMTYQTPSFEKLSTYCKLAFIAVDRITGTHGVGICPCAARYHLRGVVDLERVEVWRVCSSSYKVRRGLFQYVVEGGTCVSD